MKVSETTFRAIVVGLLMAVISLVITYPFNLIINYIFNQDLLHFIFGSSGLTFWKSYWIVGFIVNSTIGRPARRVIIDK